MPRRSAVRTRATRIGASSPSDRHRVRSPDHCLVSATFSSSRRGSSASGKPKTRAPRGTLPIARRLPRGVRLRTIHQSSISGCYPSLDYLLARRSYPRRASSLFTRRLGTGCPAPRVWAKPWSPLTPANRLPVAVAAPWSRRTGTLASIRLPANRYSDRVPPPASWRQPRRSPGEPVNLLGPKAAPARKPAAFPSCSASAARCGRLEGPPARRKRRTFETPEPPPELSSSGGLPLPPNPTDGLSSALARRCGRTGVTSLWWLHTPRSRGIFEVTGLSPDICGSSPGAPPSSTVHAQLPHRRCGEWHSSALRLGRQSEPQRRVVELLELGEVGDRRDSVGRAVALVAREGRCRRRDLLGAQPAS